MKLTIVGAAGSMSGPTSAASCYLLQTEVDGRTWSVAFDLGPGAFGQMWRYLDPRHLDAMVFSHCHADHMADVVSLLVYRKWYPGGPLRQMPVFGPEETAKRVADIDGWANQDDLKDVFDFHVMTPEESTQVGPFQIQAFPGNHTVPSFGFRVHDGTGLFAYTGDTDSCEAMVEMAKDADLLLSECGFTNADTARGIHLDGTRAGVLASEADVGQLVITHVQPWTDRDVVRSEVVGTWDGPLSFAEPGTTYQIGD